MWFSGESTDDRTTRNVPEAPEKAKATPYVTGIQRALTTLEILSCFSHLDQETPKPPQLPQGGDVYLYHSRSKPHDWKADGYPWCIEESRIIKPANLKLRKSTFYILEKCEKQGDKLKNCTNPGFSKVSFELVGHDKVILQYIGDHTLGTPHGHNMPTVHGNIEYIVQSVDTRSGGRISCSEGGHQEAESHASVQHTVNSLKGAHAYHVPSQGPGDQSAEIIVAGSASEATEAAINLEKL